ncbi:HNH endonuclease [Paraburkholderia sp. RL18-085-BIA-A]|uniref:HNH endonuclease n=1 Tax=Paraburkholderia sp. RL18-085-BIA-A TaxID=3031633 RepID=UPI0038B73297
MNVKARARYGADPEAARERQNTYYHAHKDRIAETAAVSRARNAEKIKARKKAAYERVKDDPEFIRKRNAYAASVKDQKREYDKRYRAENADRLSAVKAAWRAENAGLMRIVKINYKARRRAQEATGDSAQDIAAWESAARKVCYWCSTKCADDYHIDHYQPLSKGGEHRVSNLVIACPTCNLRKNAKDPLEFAASVGRLF